MNLKENFNRAKDRIKAIKTNVEKLESSYLENKEKGLVEKAEKAEKKAEYRQRISKLEERVEKANKIGVKPAAKSESYGMAFMRNAAKQDILGTNYTGFGSKPVKKKVGAKLSGFRFGGF